MSKTKTLVKRNSVFSYWVTWLFAVAIGFSAALPQAQAQNVCKDVYHDTSSELETPQSVGKFILESVSNIPQTSPNYALRTKILETIYHIKDPYSMIYSIRGEEKTDSDYYSAIRSLISIFVKKQDAMSRMTELNNWIKSENHALVAYDYLYTKDIIENRSAVEWLFKNNSYFQGIHSIRGPPSQPLLTYAFEKEGSSPLISLLYKDPSYSDNNWLAIPESERNKRLFDRTTQIKTSMPANQVAPTALKPDFLGGYSVESRNSVWEITHKQFEISLDRALKQVDEIAETFKETHSIHFHIVFEIAEHSPNFPLFRQWAKHVNDYLYLRGLEEGLHGNILTNVMMRPDLPKVTNLWSRISDAIFPPPETEYYFTPDRIGQQSHKFHSMGIRGRIYGPSSIPGHVKIGLELRDTTRKISNLHLYAEKITSSVSRSVWDNMKGKEKLFRDSEIEVNKNTDKTILALNEIIQPSMAQRLASISSDIGIGLIKFETGKYLNYETARLELPAPEIAARLQTARTQYITALKNLEKEIQDMERAGEIVSDDEISLAIRMNLSEWAARAKASELFDRF